MKLFRGRLAQKIHPGRNFWGLLVIAGFLLLTRMLFDESFFLNSLYVVVIYIVFAFIFTFFALDHISIERRSRYHKRQVGDLYEENLDIVNKSILPAFWMQIRDCSDLNVTQSKRIIGYLGGRQSRIIRLSSILQRRGNIALSPIEIITSDPLGCFYAIHQIRTEGSLIILPYRVDLSAVSVRKRQNEEGRSSKIAIHQNSMISGSVREYLDGDPFNRIHWPTTARRGNLHTKLPDESEQKIVWLCLDCNKKVQTNRAVRVEEEQIDFLDAAKLHSSYALPPDSFEAAVSITGSLATTWLKKGIAVGLALNQQPFQLISPGYGIRQQTEILNLLTFIRANSQHPLVALLNNLSPRLNSSVICFLVTPDDSGELVQFAYQLKQRGIDIRIVAINKASFASGYQRIPANGIWGKFRKTDFEYGDSLNKLVDVL